MKNIGTENGIVQYDETTHTNSRFSCFYLIKDDDLTGANFSSIVAKVVGV